ncbi:hypothetical protein XENTR_v10000329 [Xenopus tropicalis]|nr:hypothetical protein XENTR_v10000329 [Xenopus tropicalis]
MERGAGISEQRERSADMIMLIMPQSQSAQKQSPTRCTSEQEGDMQNTFEEVTFYLIYLRGRNLCGFGKLMSCHMLILK